MTDFQVLLAALTNGGVEFIIIGGFAATAHGSAHVTFDLDIVYRREPENMKRLATSLAPLRPYLRGAPPGLPFTFDYETVRRGLNFTLTTSAGDLDVLGEATGNGTFEELEKRCESREVLGVTVRFVDLETLIHLKRAAGRPKDLERLAELEAILEQSTTKK